MARPRPTTGTAEPAPKRDSGGLLVIDHARLLRTAEKLRTQIALAEVAKVALVRVELAIASLEGR